MLPKYRYTCPLGGSLLLADTQESLDRKVEVHDLVSHGPNSFAACGRTMIHGPQSDAESIASPRTGSERFRKAATAEAGHGGYRLWPEGKGA